MNADQARDTVAAILGQIAPEADLDDVEPDEDLRTGSTSTPSTSSP